MSMKLLTRDSFWIGLWAPQIEQRPVLRRRDQGGRGPGRGSECQESLRPTSRARWPPRPDMGLYQAPSFLVCLSYISMSKKGGAP